MNTSPNKLKYFSFIFLNIIATAYCCENDIGKELIIREPITLTVDGESIPSLLQSNKLIPVYGTLIESDGDIHSFMNVFSVAPKRYISAYTMTFLANEFSTIGIRCKRNGNNFNMTTSGSKEKIDWPEFVPSEYNYDQLVQMYLTGEILFDMKPCVTSGGKSIKYTSKSYSNTLSILHSRGPIDIKANKMECDRTLFSTPTGVYLKVRDEMLSPFIQAIQIHPKIYYYFTNNNVINQSRSLLLDGKIDFGSGEMKFYCSDVEKIVIEFSPSLLEAFTEDLESKFNINTPRLPEPDK